MNRYWPKVVILLSQGRIIQQALGIYKNGKKYFLNIENIKRYIAVTIQFCMGHFCP